MPATPAAPAGANASASATPPAADQAKIDVQALTAEQCRAGGFGAPARTP
jgi:hypothetical protein